MSEADPIVYDPVELRRRITFCFSAGELKELADSLGVGGIAWDRGLDEAAREVVRQCERYAGLPALVARLREVRPLVEWPEPAVAGMAPSPNRRPIPPTTGFAIPPTTGFPAPPTLSASPGTFGPAPGPDPAPAPHPGEPPAPLIDPYAPPPGPPIIQVPVVPAVPAAPHHGIHWPGTVGDAPPTRSSGIDPRIFIAVAGLMVVAAVIAYLAGRASSSSGETDASAAASASASVRASRGDGPAAFAADRLARSFANMARICELPSSAGASVSIFRRVFDRCGPPSPQHRTSPSPVSTADASAQPAATADPAPARPKRPGRDTAPGDAAPASKGCMGACETQHGACRAHCGPEPTESRAYDGYQRCLGGCLRDASRCRLSCR